MRRARLRRAGHRAGAGPTCSLQGPQLRPRAQLYHWRLSGLDDGQARKKAAAPAQIDQGGDPLGDIEAEREAPTMAELIDRFDAEHMTRAPAQARHAPIGPAQQAHKPYFGKHVKVADVDLHRHR